MGFLEIRHPQHEIRTNLDAVRAAEGVTWIRVPARSVSFGRGGPREPGDAHVQLVNVENLSRRHFAIVPHPGGHALVDEESTGGTFLNDGERLLAAAPRPLGDGDLIHAGAPRDTCKLIYRTGSTPRAIAVPALAKAWLALWESGDLAEFDALHADDFIDHAAPTGRAPDRAGFQAGLVALRTAFPDLRVGCDDLIVGADRDVATVRWNAHGTHKAPYLDVPPSGRIIWFRGIEIISVVRLRVAARWGEWDGLYLLAQLRGSVTTSN